MQIKNKVSEVFGYLQFAPLYPFSNFPSLYHVSEEKKPDLYPKLTCNLTSKMCRLVGTTGRDTFVGRRNMFLNQEERENSG